MNLFDLFLNSSQLIASTTKYLIILISLGFGAESEFNC